VGRFLRQGAQSTLGCQTAKAAAERLASDNRLYQHIKTGMREYQWDSTSKYGLYGFFAGEPGEYFDSSYRIDNTFQKEGRLLLDDD